MLAGLLDGAGLMHEAITTPKRLGQVAPAGDRWASLWALRNMDRGSSL